MKKSLNTLLVLLAVLTSPFSFATSIMPSVLEYGHMTVGSLAGGKSEKLEIYVNGMVVYRPLQAIFPAPKAKVVGFISAGNIDRIERLVRTAKSGRIVLKPSTAMCFAAATHIDVYTGSMGQVLLKNGAICAGGWKINQSPAAKRLVSFLDTLRGKFNVPGGGPKKASTKEIEVKFNLDSDLE